MSGSGKTARPGSKTRPTKISLVIHRKGKVQYEKKKKNVKVGMPDLLGEGEFGPTAEVLRKLTREHACITIKLIKSIKSKSFISLNRYDTYFIEWVIIRKL
jgi:hypothetical protein